MNDAVKILNLVAWLIQAGFTAVDLVERLRSAGVDVPSVEELDALAGKVRTDELPGGDQ